MEFTYGEVGATADPARLPPEGFHLMWYRTRIGAGDEVFRAAGAALLEWRMHRSMGVRMETADALAVPGARVVVGVGVGRLRLWGPCQVVWTVIEPRRTGWACGTLPGHPECGEEAFEVTQAADGTVWLTVTSFSRAASWYARASGPLGRAAQKLYARRCGQVLRGLCRNVESARGHRP